MILRMRTRLQDLFFKNIRSSFLKGAPETVRLCLFGKEKKFVKYVFYAGGYHPPARAPTQRKRLSGKERYFPNSLLFQSYFIFSGEPPQLIGKPICASFSFCCGRRRLPKTTARKGSRSIGAHGKTACRKTSG